MKPLVILALITLALFAFSQSFDSTTKASSALTTDDRRFENFDIRTDPASDATLRAIRGEPKSNGRQATVSERFKIEFNQGLDTAEVIAPRDDAASRSLALPSGRTRERVLKDFIAANGDIFGTVAIGQLETRADYSNPDGVLSFTHFTQHIDGIPVFGAEIKAGFSRTGEMFRVVNSLAPGLDARSLDKDFGAPESLVVRAASYVGLTVKESDLSAVESQRPNERRFSSATLSDTVTAEKFYFPVGNGEARPAWRVAIWSGSSLYYVIVDTTGTLLWRKNLTEEQFVPATYNVYGNTTSLLKTADGPSPFTPGCLAPTGCAQPAAIARTNFTLIGNEAPYAFNNTGWIPDTGLPVRTPADPNITDGNNLEAGIDRVAPNGVDPNGWAVGNPTRVFSYTYNPAPGIPPPGEEPLPPGPQPTPPTQFQQGVVAHGFYLINRWHDEMYRFGFTEVSGNFQHSNFGRGGSEGDRISFEIQDGSGTNAANFSITADGGRPFLQMFVWTGATPDRDGALDAQVVLHEVTHGVSGRLIGNAAGLSSNMSRGMGEGWSDFYALALLSEPTDDRFGTHAVGGYATYQILPGFDANYYYGIRRFPLAVWASRGPNGLPHNPLTFRYVNNTCNTLIGSPPASPNSAYPRGPIGTNTCDQIHNLGEVWSAMLWEARDQLIGRHGGAEGNRRVIQYVTDGMKLSPLNPTIVQIRDAILAAATISDPGDLRPMWRGFAIRGLGSNASIQNAGNGSNNTSVTEDFSLPIPLRRPARADFDGDARSDVSVFRPSDRVWYLNRSTAGFTAVTWGLSTDQLVPDDFDGDGKADIAVFRATADGSTPDYYILQSATSTISYVFWGTAGDIAVSEDFDDDSKADHAIFRPSTGQFWVRRSTDGSTLMSRPILGGVPLVGDFDGDGKGDFGTFTDGRWLLSRSEGGYMSGLIVDWGTAGDRAVHGDYDGDGRDDIAVYRPSDGNWYILNSSGGTRIVPFGISTDVPAPADYDGDGRTDIAVYRNGVWYINQSTGVISIISFGLSGDKPLPASLIP